MIEPSSEFDPVDDLALEFLARYRKGERPSLSAVEQSQRGDRVAAAGKLVSVLFVEKRD